MVELLLRSGAKVDYRPDTDEAYPRTTLCDEPLRLAIRNKHIQIARMLLEHGADPNKRYVFLRKTDFSQKNAYYSTFCSHLFSTPIYNKN